MKKFFALKVCPWCGKTPSFYMEVKEGISWSPQIRCTNKECCVKPKTATKAIRRIKKIKSDFVENKIRKVVDLWNSSKSDYIGEGFFLNKEETSSNHVKNKVFIRYIQE